ncbi:hypothetical protein lerEdw1_019953 [Lerista edwardsae]|nr:hypothetical protein lerEdw1_019953 [Lerista edwardsae]
MGAGSERLTPAAATAAFSRAHSRLLGAFHWEQRKVTVKLDCVTQLLREMQQMASRPFASINVALETDEEPPDLIGGSIKGAELPVLVGAAKEAPQPVSSNARLAQKLHRAVERDCDVVVVWNQANELQRLLCACCKQCLDKCRAGCWDTLMRRHMSARLDSATVPKPIALEPCFGNKAAVLSVFVRLPRGLGGIPPPGQSGARPTDEEAPLHVGREEQGKAVHALAVASGPACPLSRLVLLAPGLAVASALVDISQQMPIAYKEKSGAVRNRKQQPPAQPGTCI